MKNLSAGKNAVLYTLLETIDNPVGDGRHNRAPYRSDLEKNTIPRGFVFAVDEEGNIEDRSRPYHILRGKEAEALRDKLLATASAPLKGPPPVVEESIEDVLKTLPGKDATAVVLKALGLNGPQLRQLLAEAQG